jgi:ribosome biogenesis GTPase A
VAISTKKASDVAKLPGLCLQLAPHRNDNFKPLRMMIMGIPNVGKSTLMNALLKKRIAAVGDEPAITKSQQSFDLNSRMSITDTPGLLWPKIEHDSDGYMLAASHAVGTNAVVEDEVAYFLAGILLDRYPAAITQRYGFDVSEMDAVAVVEAIAKKRNCLRSSNNGSRSKALDIEKAALILLTDYRDGLLGRISLEIPKTRAAMLTAEMVQ